MRKNKKYKKKLLIILVLILVAILVMGVWYYLIYKNIKKQNQTTVEKQTTEIAKDPENKNSRHQPGTNAPTDLQNNKQHAGSANITITSIGQSGDVVYVSGIVSGATSGTCTLKLEKSGAQTIQKSASIGMQVSYYICQGFNIPGSEFSQKGQWNAKIEISTPNGNASSETKQVTIQ